LSLYAGCCHRQRSDLWRCVWVPARSNLAGTFLRGAARCVVKAAPV